MAKKTKAPPATDILPRPGTPMPVTVHEDDDLRGRLGVEIELPTQAVVVNL